MCHILSNCRSMLLFDHPENVRKQEVCLNGTLEAATGGVL